MFKNKIISFFCLSLSLSLPIFAADVVNDNQILSGASDGTAPLYECTAGATTTFANDSIVGGFIPLLPNPFLGTIPEGDPLIQITPNFGTCDNLDFTTPSICEYTCETPVGRECIGQDCVSGEDFSVINETIKIKENNTRLFIHNTDVGDVFGQGWNIEANTSSNGGLNYLDFQIKSILADTPKVVNPIDGQNFPNYMCSAGNPSTIIGTTTVTFGNISSQASFPTDPAQPFLVTGDPVIEPGPPQNCTLVDTNGTGLTAGLNAGDTCEYTCTQALANEVSSVLTFGSAGGNSFPNGVAVGQGSALEAVKVTVGRAGLLRRISNIAKAVSATDALIKDAIQDFPITSEQQARVVALNTQIADLNTQLDDINQEIDFYINPDDDGDLFTDVDEMTCGTDSRDNTDVPTDTDGDGLCNNGVDPDDDNDQFTDFDEAANATDPLDDTSFPADNDGDFISDLTDTDDDNDLVLDVDDAFPLDATETVDTDGDGIGNNEDTDDDGDGILDTEDSSPLVATGSDSNSGGSFNILGLLLLGVIGLVRRRYYMK